MSLVPIGPRSFYLPGANNLGVVANAAGEAVGVDTGIDKDAARALRKALDGAGLRLVAIISTHHHADHVGGNEFLLRNLPGVAVWAPPLEAALIQHPELEPICLYGGAWPPAALRGKWLLSKGSPVHHLIAGEQLEIAGIGFEVIPIPGHSPNMVAVAADGVCFASDGLFGVETLAKHGVPFGHRIAAQLASVERLAATSYACYLPSHGTLVAAAELDAALIQPNLGAIQGARAAVLAALAEPGRPEQIVERSRAALGHTLAGLPQHYLFSSTIAAYLAWLEEEGLAELEFAGGAPSWRAR
jgi:glyoxylase-like metal-dependent hydrolase (beta-lactamase superfamily II)